jgi:phosphatidylglycerophosphatase A
LLAIGICEAAEAHLNQVDPGCIVWDEVVAVPVCFIGHWGWFWTWQADGKGWLFVLIAFLLFRFFDILKPLGIKRLQSLHGGLGCVLDDVAAAILTALSLGLLRLLA